MSERGAAAADGAAGAEVAAAAEAALAEAAARGAAEAAEAVEDAQRHHAHHGQHDQRETARRRSSRSRSWSARARLKGGPQVSRMLQANPGRSGKQEQKQNSLNLGPAFQLTPVHESEDK